MLGSSTSDPEEIGAFLVALGLAELEPVFEANHVDMAVLCDLNEADLRELGLTLGQRKKILARIAALQTHPLPRSVGPSEPDQGQFELRRISVMFCDMVGSTNLAQRLTPDKYAEVIQFYYRIASRVTREFGGYISTLQGDGIVVIFGYPKATGAHAERAIMAGLAMIEAYSYQEYQFADGQSEPIRARVGIASGSTIVGIGDANVSRNEVYMFGSTPNKAARIQSHALPNKVLVDDETRVQSGDHFDFERLEDATLKGFDDNIPLSRVIGFSRGIGGQSVAAKAEPTLSLIGRDTEWTTLADAWNAARSGHPRLIVIGGDAGLGKSRLRHVAEHLATADNAHVLRLACAPLFASHTLRPVIETLGEIIGRSGETAPAARLDALRFALRDPSAEELSRVAQLMDLPPPEPDTGGDGAAARDKLLQTLTRWLLGGGDRPILLTVEDAQWADSSTRELLGRVAGQLAEQRLMIVLTTRNQPEMLWQDHSMLQTLSLSPLSDDEAARFLDNALGDRTLPLAIRQRILEHSGGNPLMIEDLALSSEHWSEGVLTEDIAVPTSIYESIASRLDLMPGSRAVANMLAVFGMEVREEILGNALGMTAVEIEQHLEYLRRASMLAERVGRGSRTVKFGHMLYRDVVYERLVGSVRTTLHRRAADALRGFYTDIAERQPEILAWHYYCAHDFAASAPLALQAGERAAKRSAVIEASHHLDQALSAADRLEDTPETLRLRLRALSAMAAVKRARFGIAHDDVAALSMRIQKIALEIGDTQAALLALNGLYSHALVKADYPEAGRWARKLIGAARDAGDGLFEVIGMRAAGGVAFHTGQFDTAAELLQHALDGYDEQRHGELTHAHGYDHAEICDVFLSFAHWMRGDLEGARRFSADSVAHSRRIAHAHSLTQALAFRAMLGSLARDSVELGDAGVEAKALGEKLGHKVMSGVGTFFREVAVLLIAPDSASDRDIEIMLRNREIFLSVNPYNYGCLAEVVVAEIFMRRGDQARVRHHLELALAVETRTGEIWSQPERLRLEARLLALGDDVDAELSALQAAYRAAQAMGANTIALRTACDIAEQYPSAAARDRVAASLALMVSLDGGWDETRARRLLAT